MEKVVFTQNSSYLLLYTLDKFQAAFWALHSTESALLKVRDDILMTMILAYVQF